MKKLILLLTFIGCLVVVNAQTELVFVYFKDKPNQSTFFANPLSELSQKALDRRTNLGIPLNNQDAPIETTYIQNIVNLGFTVTDMSKWLNGVAVNATKSQITLLESQPYVQSVESFVKDPTKHRDSPVNKWKDFNENNKIDFNYGVANAQITQINLKTVHQSGYTGQGVTIAMLDTGYPYVNIGSAYARLRNAGKIKGGYNFVSKNTDIYNTNLNTHGAVCMGAIGGYIQNQFVGTAPDADFYLYATEDGINEIPEEELYWIEAAEEADRVGVDVISSSLGYTDFDDARYDYTYEDMTGQRSFIARGAQIASEKGIIVVVACGNSGESEWHYLGTPGDNEKVFTIGGVDVNGNNYQGSSYGPNALGKIKPDASARAVNTYSVFNNSATFATGTSLATPLAAGGIACLLQYLPKTTNRENIKSALRNTSSLAPNYDDQLGYGILNFGNALNTLSLKVNDATLQKFNIYPNPSNGNFTIDATENTRATIFDTSGKLIDELQIKKGKNDILLQIIPGTYLIKFENSGEKNSTKILIK